jgi:hypothetical protein
MPNKLTLLFSLLLIVAICETQGQLINQELGVLNVMQEQVLWEGEIAGRPIDIFIAVHDYAVFNRQEKTYLGWYRIKPDGLVKPLVGRMLNEGLTLYHFAIADSGDRFLHIPNDPDLYYKDYAAFDSVDHYLEKMVLRAQNSIFIKQGEEAQPLYLKDFFKDIEQEEEYLQLANGNYLSLSEFAPLGHGYQFIAAKQDQVLLSYSYLSNSFGMGRCGAGFESGLAWLNFSDEGQYQSTNYLLIESCWKGIYTDSEILDSTRIQFMGFSGLTDTMGMRILDLKGYNISPESLVQRLYEGY